MEMPIKTCFSVDFSMLGVRIPLMVYLIQHYVIKCVTDLRQVGGFLRVLRFPPPIKTDLHNITEI